jgi:DNA polymerase IV
MRIIFHIDMDAFFAAVEQRDSPEFADKPVIIGADPKGGRGRGVVSTASYEARKFGIHSAMPISRAYDLCPQGIFVKPRMDRYSEISETVFSIFRKYTPLVEETGIDEGFIDCTGCERLFGSPIEIAKKIKKDIYNETSLTASIGIASNKSVAKIASDMNKPDGITICKAGYEREFLAPLPIGKLWGAGKVTVVRLESVGIKKIGDLASLEPSVAESILGKSGLHLWYMSQGKDDRPVVPDLTDRKSISEEHTFERDTDDRGVVYEIILRNCDRVTTRLRSAGMKARTVTLKIRLEGFETHTRRITVNEPFNDLGTMKKHSFQLFGDYETKGKKIRLIGVGVSGLIQLSKSEDQGLLFPSENIKVCKSEKILDSLRMQYGNKVSRASLMNRGKDIFDD